MSVNASSPLMAARCSARSMFGMLLNLPATLAPSGGQSLTTQVPAFQLKTGTVRLAICPCFKIGDRKVVEKGISLYELLAFCPAGRIGSGHH